jgi:hypothetical protein
MGDELKALLQSLLDHDQECEVEHCPKCATLTLLCQCLHHIVFETHIYPEQTIAARRGVLARCAGQ